MSPPSVVLRSKFVTPDSNTFSNFINYMDREDAKHHIELDTSSGKEDDFRVFYNFMDYMDDDEKQGELFTSNKDRLSDSGKQKLKNQFQFAQINESPMWQDVISFDNDWLAKQGIYHPKKHELDEARMKNIVRETMNTVLKSEGMEHSAVWTGSIHYNTDNIHIHIASTEPYPTREKMNVFDKETNTWKEEYRAKRKPKTLDKMKSKVANMMLDRTNERNKIDELVRGTVHDKKESGISLSSYRKTKALFQEAVKRLPSDKRQWKYGYQSINEARPYIDEMTDIYLQQFHEEELEELQERLDEEVNIMKEMYGEGSDYEKYKATKLEDLKKRMGNAVLAEMRAYGMEEKAQSFWYAEPNSRKPFSFYHSNHAATSFHVAMMKINKAMRKTFQDYEKERNQQEFDRIMDGYE